MLQTIRALANTAGAHKPLRHFATFQLLERVVFPSYYPSLNIRKGKERPGPHYILQPTSPGTSFTASTLEVPYPKTTTAFEVHHGTLTFPFSDPSNQTELREFPDVLLKLFRPKVDERSNVDGEGDPSELTDGSTLAWEEAWSLCKLSELQGRVVPKYYGTFVVRRGGSEEDFFAVAVPRVKGASVYDKFKELGCTDDLDTRWYELARALFSQIFDFHQRGVCRIDSQYRNILVTGSPAETHPLRGHPSLKFPLHFMDLSNACPTTFPPNDEPDNDKSVEQYFADEMRANDLRGVDDTLIEMCSECWHYSWRCFRRRWAFYDWMLAEHAEDAWFQAWWEPFLKDHIQRGRDIILKFQKKRRRALEEGALSSRTGKKARVRGSERVKVLRKLGREVKKWKKLHATWRVKARNTAFKRVVRDRALENLGEPLWKVHWLRRFLRGRDISEIERKPCFVRIREVCPSLMRNNAPGNYWVEYCQAVPRGLGV